MKNFDELKDFFDYSNKREWVKYIETNVLPIWRCTAKLLEFHARLIEEFKEKTLSEIREGDYKLFLGGIEKNGDYTSNSLAEFYNKFFGLSINVFAWIKQEEFGKKISEIDISGSDTIFIQSLTEIKSILDIGLKNQNLVKYQLDEILYEDLKDNPEKLKDLFFDFYDKLLNISINYNYKTFFLCSINQITDHFIKAAYPKFEYSFLSRELGLNIMPWKNLIEDKALSEDYKIYCFPEYNPNKPGDSFGGSIVKLNEYIWDFISDWRIKDCLEILIEDVPNLKKEYKNKIEQSFEEFLLDANDIRYEKFMVDKTNKTVMEALDEKNPYFFTNLIKIINFVEYEHGGFFNISLI